MFTPTLDDILNVTEFSADNYCITVLHINYDLSSVIMSRGPSRVPNNFYMSNNRTKGEVAVA